ncbi:hypothetical protein QUA20_10375 [Microcoleus sp. Pol7_A1]|uniref:hypothetical protein n=1 Tax=Microcoleus sp. Pol7_A1 TaxID=2818893 RepID=UPI002FD34F69
MNVQLVESLIQVILSLAADEQLALAGKILKNIPYPLTQELVQLAQKGGYFNFLNNKPEIYTLQYREAIA